MEKTIGIILIIAVVLVGMALVFLFIRRNYARLVSAGLLLAAVAAVAGGVIYCREALSSVWSKSQFIMLAVLAAASAVLGIVTIIVDVKKFGTGNKNHQEAEGVDER